MRKLNYTIRDWKLESLAKMLDVTLEFKLLRGHKYVWQVKLGKVYIHSPGLWTKYRKVERAVSKHESPNCALRNLCDKLSNKTVVAPQVRGQDKIMTLGLVEYGSLYLRQTR